MRIILLLISQELPSTGPEVFRFDDGSHTRTLRVLKSVEEIRSTRQEVATGSLRELLSKQEGLLAKGETFTVITTLWSWHQRLKLESGAHEWRCRSSCRSGAMTLSCIWQRLLPHSSAGRASAKAKHLSHEFVVYDRAGPRCAGNVVLLNVCSSKTSCAAEALSLCEMQ